MKKERMTVEELRGLLKENPEGVELVCDTKEYTKALKRIKVLSLGIRKMILIDGDGSEVLLGTGSLAHYPSQREPKVITLYEILFNGSLEFINDSGRSPKERQRWTEVNRIQHNLFQGYTGRTCEFDVDKWRIVKGSFGETD